MAGVKFATIDVKNQIKALIYGNCIGDALGLLTEFMDRKQANYYYGTMKDHLEYEHKVNDHHRRRWAVGDWTDDSDQMILIMMSVNDNNGKVNAVDYAQKLLTWSHEGFQELGDQGGNGIGMTTWNVLNHSSYATKPHTAAKEVWESMGRNAAPNGALMRTSVLGALQYQDLKTVSQNTLEICKVTHADPRCQLSCVAMTTAIALMLQRKHFHNGEYDVKKILQDSFSHAIETVLHNKNTELCKELDDYMFKYSSHKSLSPLKLDEDAKIGYTYKCLGAGCWALRQDNFEEAMQAVVMEAGDADTNGAVAGALLGCKLGLQALRVKRGSSDWLMALEHKDWLDPIIDQFLCYVDENPASGKPQTLQNKAEGEMSGAQDRTEPIKGKTTTVTDRSLMPGKGITPQKQEVMDITENQSNIGGDHQGGGGDRQGGGGDRPGEGGDRRGGGGDDRQGEGDRSEGGGDRPGGGGDHRR